jgi:hypothetical protein
MRIERITTAVIEPNYDWTVVRVEGDDGHLRVVDRGRIRDRARRPWDRR